jgi:hypothetical protein
VTETVKEAIQNINTALFQNVHLIDNFASLKRFKKSSALDRVEWNERFGKHPLGGGGLHRKEINSNTSLNSLKLYRV